MLNSYVCVSNNKQPVFNSSIPDGGNPELVDVNAQYAGLEFHYTYLIFCGFIVWLVSEDSILSVL
jgi:hypothetical protein